MEITNETIETNSKKKIEKLKNSLRLKIAENQSYAEEVADIVVTRIVEEILREIVLDVHRAIKLGYSDMVFAKIYDHSLDEVDLPFYPKNVDSKTEDINCPKCHKLIHASRFAPHLEKCMKLGRSSSRIASQRIASNSKECSYSDEDDDWKAEKSRSVKKFDGKKKKDSARKQKPYNADLSKNQKDGGNGITSNIKDIFQSPSKSGRETYGGKGSKDQDSEVWISPNKVGPGIGDDKSPILSTRCGVRSDHTGKYCGRSLRCPLHSDADRAVARKLLSGESMDIDVEDVDYSKNVLGSFSQLNLTPPTPTSKKKEKQKHGTPKY